MNKGKRRIILLFLCACWLFPFAGWGEAQIIIADINLWEATKMHKPLDPEYLRTNVLAPEFNNNGQIEYPLKRIYSLGTRLSF